MFNNHMPVGVPYYFEGDINYFDQINFNYPTELNNSLYEYLNEIFNKTKFGGYRTIAPVGK